MRDRSVLDGLHPDNPTPDTVALQHIRPPLQMRRAAGFIAMLLPLLLCLGIVIPWQQSAVGSGNVIAYAPEERQQTVEAPFKGRIVNWFVAEGEAVTQGSPLVEIRDNDEQLVARMEDQRRATEEERRSVDEQIASYTRKLEATVSSRDSQLAELDAKIQETQQKRIGFVSEANLTRLNLDRTRTLAAEGLASIRKLEVAETKNDKAMATIDALDRQISAQRRSKQMKAADADGKIASVEAELEAARSKAADVRRKLLDLEVKLARQSAQVVRAPRDGLVLRLHGTLGGAQVKAGDPLVSLVPDSAARAVEIAVDGNDMPLIQQGDEVRLVFEGWPALQMVGLPGANHGTFAGAVAFVDATDDGKGKFRVVVVPATDAPWPESNRLRQGVRAKGFVLLGQVSLGYELWRQINGFPPLPDIDKTKGSIPSSKKPRSPSALK